MLKKDMEDIHVIMYVLLLAVLIMTLMMAWASHRKLKTHQYYLQALIEHEIIQDETMQAQQTAGSALDYTDVAVQDAPVADQTMPPAAAASLRASGSLFSSGEMCNDLRSPLGGKIYNRDCMTAAMVGSKAPLKPTAAGIPNLNTLIQTNYPKSG